MQKTKQKLDPIKKNTFLWFLGIIPILRISHKITADSTKNTYWLFCLFPLFSTERYFDKETSRTYYRGK